MICPKCGKDAGAAKFCPECGEILAQESIATNETNPQKKKKKKGCFFALLIPVILCILFVVGIKVGFIQFENTAKMTQAEYPKAEEFDAYSVMFYELNNNVKRKSYLQDVISKRYRFYLKVDKIQDKNMIRAKHYPTDQFQLDEKRALATLNEWRKTDIKPKEDDYINFLYWYSGRHTITVEFDDEIWDLLETGDKIIIEGSCHPNSLFDRFDGLPNVENAVIIEKNGEKLDSVSN